MRWHTRAADHEQALRAAKAERQPIRRADTFLEHGLDAETSGHSPSACSRSAVSTAPIWCASA